MTPKIECPICRNWWFEGGNPTCHHTDEEWARYRTDFATPEDATADLSHDDICRLSRMFNEHANLGSSQDYRINEWLKQQIADRSRNSEWRHLASRARGSCHQLHRDVILSSPLRKDCGMNEPNPHGHYWADCPLCGRMVVCGKCGNNSCNGGYGTLPDGLDCDACPSAYEMQNRDEKS